MKTKIVIVGAGYAGILTAKKLSKKFKNKNEVSITIIDRNPYHALLTELHEVAASRVNEESIRASLKKIFAERNVKVELDNVTSFDFDKKQVVGEENTYDYDYLVLSAGSKPTFFGVKGAAENTFQLWSYDDALAIRHHIQNVFSKASRLRDKEERKKVLTFFIVGAGFTGVEMAGELAEYIPIITEKFEIDRDEVSVNIVDILSRTIPNLPEALSRKAERKLKNLGVKVILNSNVCEVGPDYIQIIQNEKCNQYQTNTVVWAAGVESADIAGKAAEVLESGNRNRIKTDAYLRSINYENVFVIGDNMFYTPEGEEDPVPQVVENCEQSAAIASYNIYCSIAGKESLKKYKPKFHGFMVSIGGRYGLARVGFPNFMVNLPSFLAMFVKHFINVVYFAQILGWNKVFSYLKHEFFTIRNCRSFVGGHFSNRTPSFLIVPLRLWLGFVWIFEGIKKVNEGWFVEAKLTSFFGSANDWFNSILGIASESVEATSWATPVAGANEAAQSAGTALINWNILGLFKVYFVSGKELIESGLSDFALKLDIPFINWFIDNVVLSGEKMQIFMQSGIVIAEIAIGFALIGGLFTFPAAGVSLILLLMFICTTGVYLNNFWMIFAGIAVLIGGGRIFGLDYYVMPRLKKWWKNIPIVRKLYIYND
jgi:NADH:ubiquinone reductase (H+-translocating)